MQIPDIGLDEMSKILRSQWPCVVKVWQ